MKNFFIFLFIVFSAFFLINGCDSPSGSKPDVVSKPVLVSPVDNATNVSTAPVFKWTGTADKLEIATNPNFGTGDIKWTATINNQQYQMPPGKLNTSTLYFWHVGKTSGSSVDWSTSIFSFTTVNR